MRSPNGTIASSEKVSCGVINAATTQTAPKIGVMYLPINWDIPSSIGPSIAKGLIQERTLMPR